MLAFAAGLDVVVRVEGARSTPAGWLALLSSGCMFVFYLALCWLMLHRPPAAARSAGILPSIIAFAGTYLPWSIVLFEPATMSAGQSICSALLLLAGVVLMLVVIRHLGVGFSIVPEARRLVRTGPYAVVRHPLYAAEEVALAGTLVAFFSPVTVVLLLAHGALQVRRILYEDEVLRGAFPEFADYARSTCRLVPFVW